jgi:hypothetical protein
LLREQALRAAEMLQLTQDEVLALSPDNHIVRFDAMHDVRFGKRAGVCRLTYVLADGVKCRWRWLNRYSPSEEVEAILARVLGERLTNSRAAPQRAPPASPRCAGGRRLWLLVVSAA